MGVRVKLVELLDEFYGCDPLKEFLDEIQSYEC